MHIIGFHQVWLNYNTFSNKRLKHTVFNKLKQFKHLWLEKITSDDSKSPVKGCKLRTFRTLKVEYELKMDFLIDDLPKWDILSNCNFSLKTVLLKETFYITISILDWQNMTSGNFCLTS